MSITLVEHHLKDFIYEERQNGWFDIDMSLYHCQFEKDVYSDIFFNSLGIKFPVTLEKAVQKRKAEYLAGRYCAAKSLQGLGMFNVDIGTGQHRNPLWPSNILGSITHCGNHAAAITTNQPNVFGIGIDIEDEVSFETMHRIKGQILCAEEIGIICGDGGDCIPFTLAFSVKESFFKAAYPTVQKYFDFDAITILDISHLTRQISFRINRTLNEKLKKDEVLRGTFMVLQDHKVVTLVILD